MKTRTAVFLLAVLLQPTAILLAQKQGTGICRLNYRLVNRARHVDGHHLAAECPGFTLHTAPFGNWGVDSNLQNRQNSRQFDGWKLIDGFWQWNSCTSNTSRFPTGCDLPTTYYNAANCTEQHSDYGLPNYDLHATNLTIDCQVSCAYNGPGCIEVDGYNLTIANHFIKTYELDSPGTDVLTGHLQFGDQTVQAVCLGDLSCSGSISTWELAYDSSTGVRAEAAVEITGGQFIDRWGQCGN